MLDKLLILDPKLGDLTMPRFVEQNKTRKLVVSYFLLKGIERVNVA